MSAVVDAAVFATVAIANLDEALTFARHSVDGHASVVAVTSYRQGKIEGVDLSLALGREVSSPSQVFVAEGYDRLQALIAGADAASRVVVPAEQLLIPENLRDRHIAAGTNYPEHAEDAGTERPFLFAKMVTPTSSRAPVSAGQGLLDYEVEIAWVPLEPLRAGSSPSSMGLILCNDYTDRETLMRLIRPRDIESGVGFTTGKSFAGFLPVGDLFVIPRDFRAFAAALPLRLYVDNELRQSAGAGDMIWGFDEIVAQTWARKSVTWEHRGGRVSLTDGADSIPAGTLLMAGTPRGTVFDGLHARHVLGGLRKWLLGGWGRSIQDCVADAYGDDARSNSLYLQPGDEVVIHVDRLGTIQNTVSQ